MPGNIERGLLQGAGFGRLPTIGFVNLDFQVNEGDPVVTSGIRESLFPPDIPVGRVADVKRTPGSLQLDVRVEPAADLNRLQFVAVLRYLPAVVVVLTGFLDSPWIRAPVVIILALAIQTGVVASFRPFDVTPDLMLLLAVAGGSGPGARARGHHGCRRSASSSIWCSPRPSGCRPWSTAWRRSRSAWSRWERCEASKWVPVLLVTAASAAAVVLYAVLASVFGLERAVTLRLVPTVFVVATVNGLLAVPAHGGDAVDPARRRTPDVIASPGFGCASPLLLVAALHNAFFRSPAAHCAARGLSAGQRGPGARSWRRGAECSPCLRSPGVCASASSGS